MSKKNASLSKDLGIYCAGFVCALCLLGNRVPETATLIKTRKRDTFKKRKLSNIPKFFRKGLFFYFFYSLNNVFFKYKIIFGSEKQSIQNWRIPKFLNASLLTYLVLILLHLLL